MTELAPKLKVVVTHPLWMYDEGEQHLLSSLLLICDKIITLDLPKHCYKHDHVDKARGFFAAYIHDNWCSAAWDEGLLEEPDGIDEVVIKCRDSLKEQAQRDGTVNKLRWPVNPEELVARAYLELSRKGSLQTRGQVYPLSISDEAPATDVHSNTAVVAHYYLARAALAVALPSIPVFENAEQVLQVRTTCLQSGELAQFQALIRRLTSDLNAMMLGSASAIDIEGWASAKAETDVRLSLYELDRKISSLKSSRRFAFLRDKECLTSLFSLIDPTSWVGFLKNIVVNLPGIAEGLQTLIDPETQTLKRNPSLAYLYRLSKASTSVGRRAMPNKANSADVKSRAAD